MTTLRLLVAGLLGGCGLVFLTPAVSHACSCAIATPQQYADAADVVFTGTLVDVAPPPRRLLGSSGDPVSYTFEVDAVHAGDAAAATEVRSAVSGASCGIEGLEVGTTYVVFAMSGKDGLLATSCGGTAPAGASLVRAVDRILGPPEAPQPVPAEPEPSRAGGVTQWLLVGAAGLVAAGTGALVVRRRP